ncbi:MAG: OmpA family protein [Nitrospirota bacterium]
MRSKLSETKKIERFEFLKCWREVWIILCSLLLALCSMLSFPNKLNAFIEGVPVTYIDVITEDEEGGKTLFPSFVFTEDGMKEIYIIDSDARVVIYTSDFFPIFTLDKADGVHMPQGLTIDKSGNFYIAQAGTNENPRHRLSVYNACLKWTRDIYFHGFEGSASFIPYRLVVDKKGDIYVASYSFPGIVILNNDGQFIDILSPEEEDRKVQVNYVTLDKAGRIYLVSEEVSHIYVYDENRNFLFKFGQKGGGKSKLSRPQAVAVDNRNGRIYVVDYMRHTVSAYDKNGEYLFEFGGLGWGEGWFQYPRDIAVDSQGRIFVADTFNDRIQVFQPVEEEIVAQEVVIEEKITEEQVAKIETEAEEKEPEHIEKVIFKDIYFDTDKYDIKADARPILKEIASWLRKNTSAGLLIEGHCDEMDTNEYNLALGEKRANAAKDYLISLGVPSKRIETISYGEEKSVCRERTKECMQKNRRVHFVIIKK